MGDVIQHLIDGTSGIAPGGVDGKALVAGVCSKGRVGKAYLIGKRSDLEAMLGQGPLVERVREMLDTGGQEPYLVAVPVQGQPGGYLTEPQLDGTGPQARLSGYPAKNADVKIRVKTAGPVASDDSAADCAEIEINIGGERCEAGNALPRNVIGDTGATLLFNEGDILVAGDVYSFSTRVSVGPVERIGDGQSPLVEVVETSGGVLAAAELVIRITKGGGRNEGSFQLSIDGGDNYQKARTIPVNGEYPLYGLGVTLNFPEGAYATGTTYECRLLAPVPSIVDVLDALDSPLNVHDVEFVHVVGESDSVDWMACQAKAEELWNLHRPTYFKLETRLPRSGEDLSDYAAWLLAERQGVSCRFVTVCAQFGEVGRLFAPAQRGRIAGRARNFNSRPAGHGPRQGRPGLAIEPALWLGSRASRPGRRRFSHGQEVWGP